MNVHEVMTTQPECCGPDTNVARAVQLIWDADCGALPIVDDIGRVVGIVTDRDICVALGTRNLRASDVLVREVMQTAVETCRTDDDVRVALDKMRERRVRRLPAVDENGRLKGILSLDDLVLASTGPRGVRPAQLLEVLREICKHRLPAPKSPEALVAT